MTQYKVLNFGDGSWSVKRIKNFVFTEWILQVSDIRFVSKGKSFEDPTVSYVWGTGTMGSMIQNKKGDTVLTGYWKARFHSREEALKVLRTLEMEEHVEEQEKVTL